MATWILQNNSTYARGQTAPHIFDDSEKALVEATCRFLGHGDYERNWIKVGDIRDSLVKKADDPKEARTAEPEAVPEFTKEDVE